MHTKVTDPCKWAKSEDSVPNFIFYGVETIFTSFLPLGIAFEE